MNSKERSIDIYGKCKKKITKKVENYRNSEFR